MGEPQIDEKLYNRQIYALSRDAMKKIMTTSVLIIGLNGLGIEIAKDLTLAGVKLITLYDDGLVELKDLSSQYYFSIDQIGKIKRSDACIDKVRELNNYVKVDNYTGSLFDDSGNFSLVQLNKYNVLVLVNQTFEFSTMVNQYCNENKIHFIHVETRGVFGMLFNDFGNQFQIDDIDGEEPLSYGISSIVQGKNTTITLSNDKCKFNNCDLIKFKEVMGMTQLNDLPPMKINPISLNSFSIDIDSTEFPCHISGGFVYEVKQPKIIDFKPMNEILKSKENILNLDESKIEQSNNLFIGFKAIHKFNKENGYFPRPHNLQDANSVIEIAKQFNSGNERFDENLILQLSYVSQGDISPIQSILGGIASQEVLKACSGKFEPIHQMAFFSSEECLPNNFELMEQDEFQPIGSRYDGQIIVFGKTLQNKIQDLNYFLVGAGSLGCEILKNFAMMGLGTGLNGMVHLADMDIIKKSNLNSQFLYRMKDLHQNKSKVAENSILKMNSSINIKTYNIKVEYDSEPSFSDGFYQCLDGICNALDSIDSRLYMDVQSVNYRKPLLDPGTKGTKGSLQVIIPHLTESYSSSRDPIEMQHYTHSPFPNIIEHTIRFSLNNFEKLFGFEIDSLISYIKEPNNIEIIKEGDSNYRLHETLSQIKSSILEFPWTLTFNQCITWARLKFQDIFVNEPIQLLTYFPIDHIQKDGTPFWSGQKRIPTPLSFDINNQLHMDFIVSASKLRAQNFGITINSEDETIYNIKQQLNQIKLPIFIPKENHFYQSSPNAMPHSDIEEKARILEQCKTMIDQIPKALEFTGFKIKPISFEKDDDLHIDFITANSNLRAFIHSIGMVDNFKVKLIAGQIIPILITTTSTIAGYTCIELIKTIQNKPLSSYRNSFINLSNQSYNFVEPIKAKVDYVRPDWSFNIWDRFEINGDITLMEFLDLFQSKYKLNIVMLSCRVTLLYALFTNQKIREERLKTKISVLYEQLSKKPLPQGKNYLMLDLCCTGIDDDDDIETPPIRYKIK